MKAVLYNRLKVNGCIEIGRRFVDRDAAYLRDSIRVQTLDRRM